MAMYTPFFYWNQADAFGRAFKDLTLNARPIGWQRRSKAALVADAGCSCQAG